MSNVSNMAGSGGVMGWARRSFLLTLIALGVTAIGANSASAKDKAVPFKAEVSGTMSPGFGTFTLAGQGNASQLGKISYAGNGLLAADGMSSSLVEMLTAANGDTLTLLCLQVIEDLGGGVLHGTDRWTVIGGTGRFRNASGSGTGETFVHDMSTFTKTSTGTISY